MKTRNWIITFAAVLVLLAGINLIIRNIGYSSRVAIIRQNGTIIYEIDLNSVIRPYELTVTGEDGCVNTIYVAMGEISMSTASCPDQICVNHRPISDGVEPIVCLPNQVTIQIEKTDADKNDSFVG